MRFSTIQAVVMDMDGVLWRGESPLPGLVEWFAWLRENRTPFALATNNSSTTPADYVAKLARLGVEDVPEAAVLTSSTATAAYLQGRYPAGTSVYVLGMNGVREALLAAGFDVVDEGAAEAQVVVVGIDFDLTYNKLKRAALLVREGAELIGTNADRTFPRPEGLVPGAGSLLAAVEAATDCKATVIGKPAAPMFEAALKYLQAAPDDTLMVGDRLDTDIAGAQALGLRTVLVFTGVTTPADLGGGAVWPDAAFDDLPAVLRAWAGDAWWQAQVKAKRAR